MDYQAELDRVEQAIGDIECAIDYLKSAGSMEDVIEELTDRMDALKKTRDTIHREIEAQEAREDEALRREYFAAVV